MKMPCICSPKSKAIQSHVRKQNHSPNFGICNLRMCISTKHYRLDIKHRLWYVDCRLNVVYLLQSVCFTRVVTNIT